MLLILFHAIYDLQLHRIELFRSFDSGALAIAGHDDVAWASLWPGADAFHGGGSPAEALGGAVDGARHAGHVHLHLLG